jgi:hypothetical protein
MILPINISRLLIGAACCAQFQAAIASAQETPSSHGAAWRTNVELGALWHADGAIGENQPAYQWTRTGFAGGIGIGRFGPNGRGVRLALRGFGNRETPSALSAPCPSSGCSTWQGSLTVVGVSLDLANGISTTGLPIGIETGPDLFRTLSRPHNDRLTAPLMATLGGWHVTALLELGRRSPFELTAGADWLSGGILSWTIPVGLRYAF